MAVSIAQRTLARALAAGTPPEKLDLPELPATVGAVPGVDRVRRVYRCALGSVELEYLPNLATFDGNALWPFMRDVLGGELLLEPERLAGALADAMQDKLDAVQLIVVVWYLDRTMAEARRGL
jgi:hypothetical protein